MKTLSQLALGLMILVVGLFTTTSQANTANHQLEQLLVQHQGKVIYLDFWASWCLPCRKSFPWMKKIQNQFNSQDFTVISINLDAEAELADDFLKNNPVNFPVVFDPNGDIAAQYKLKGMPTSYLIGRDGKIKIEHVGFFTKKQPQYEREISYLIGEPDDQK